MNKLFQFLDNWLLKIGVCLIIAFIPLYPKLPSISITHTWVYIRLEDFLIGIVVLIWFIQLLRKKVSFSFSLSIPLGVYWLIGLCSLIFSVLFIGPHIANFFPKIAALEYLRRIEYMILFFVGFSSIRTKKDIRDYLVILSGTLLGILLYGFCQRFYLSFWAAFPNLARQFSFCFPSFQTGNEEFAKGIPLCLPSDARITSTFGGHYDLAAYLVVVVPIMVGIFAVCKNIWARIAALFLSIGGVLMLIFTASRISFAAFLIGATITLLFLKQKKYILPLYIISVILLVAFSSSLEKRFLETIRFTSVVTTTQGQVVGLAPSTLPADLQKKVAKDSAIEANVPSQALPVGTLTTSLPLAQTPQKTNVAIIKTNLSEQQSKALKLQNGGVEISTVSGNFLIQKALVYDISFTTRFQGEWPNAWAAFIKNPPLGSGYSTITLASDNDYLRALGESGFLGFISFFFIFVIFGIYVNQTIHIVRNNTEKALVFGLVGGVIGLCINASLIDVFESSKVAESLWLLLGIGAGSLYLYHKGSVDYWKGIKAVIFSPVLIACYFLVIAFVLFSGSVNNFFVGDDFTWLHWAASATSGSFKGYFFDSNGFFYRPIAKIIMLFLYTFFSFYPQGYHIFMILLQFLMAFGIYLLAKHFMKNKYLAFLAGVLFLLLPGRAEDFFWISSLSIVLSSIFVLYALIFFVHYREKSSLLMYVCSLILGIVSVFTYEGAIIFPLLFVLYDVCVGTRVAIKKSIVPYTLYILGVIVYLGMRFKSNALAPSGDYAYSLPHFIPNFFGNLFGYVSVFLFGESALSWYTSFRTNLKAFSLVIILLIIVALSLIIWKMFTGRFVQTITKNEPLRKVIFFCGFIIVALLPFLGLGNMTLRYGYLASAGVVILLIYLCNYLLCQFDKKMLPVVRYGIVSFVFIMFGIFAFMQLMTDTKQWNQAGQITNNVLSYIKVYDDDVPPGAYFYFVNLPIKYQNAWVFPVGLEDGIWFIFRDPTAHIVKVSSVSDAVAQSLNHSKTSYIFIFDNKGKISEVDHHNL